MLLAQLSDGFQSLPALVTSKLGPSGGDSWVGVFVYILGPCGSLQQTLLGDCKFLPRATIPAGFFSPKFCGYIFPMLEPLVVLCVLFHVVPSGLSACIWGTTCSTSYHLAQSDSFASPAPVF